MAREGYVCATAALAMHAMPMPKAALRKRFTKILGVMRACERAQRRGKQEKAPIISHSCEAAQCKNMRRSMPLEALRVLHIRNRKALPMSTSAGRCTIIGGRPSGLLYIS
jgi:hypothetical protein